jgi:hypothetical protein
MASAESQPEPEHDSSEEGSAAAEASPQGPPQPFPLPSPASLPYPPRGLKAVEAALKYDDFDGSTSHWLRRQAALLELDAYRYLIPETESDGMARIRKELDAGREIVPARVLYRLALQFLYEARNGATVWDEGMFLYHNL